MREALGAAVQATGSAARLRWVPDEVLVVHDVEPWDELPLWIPPATGAGTWAVGTERAQAAGLRCRPVTETVADTSAWLRDGGAAAMGDWRTESRPRGLTAERERELLAA
jgi:2'-hydroxyisoflavone reductase